jgi:hypothetical protein
MEVESFLSLKRGCQLLAFGVDAWGYALAQANTVVPQPVTVEVTVGLTTASKCPPRQMIRPWIKLARSWLQQRY